MLRRLLAMLALAATMLAQRSTLDAAWDLVAKGQTVEAAALLEQLIRKEPSNGDARLLLGSLLAVRGNLAAAIAQLKEGVRWLPNSAEGHNSLGEALNSAKDAQHAREEFEKAVQLNPKLAQAQLNLGTIQAEAGELEPAADHLDRAIQLMGPTEDAALPHYLRAKVYTQQGEKEKAAAELNAAVRLRPDFDEAWSELGQARKTLLDDAGALAAFERSVALDPQNGVSQMRLGCEYRHQKQPHQAVVHLQKAMQLIPEDQTVLFNLQLALREDGQEEQARAVKSRLVELLRKSDETREKGLTATRLNNEGVDLAKSGDFQGAEQKFRAAHDLNPDNNGIRFNLAVMLRRLGRWKEALAELHECLARDPENPKIKAAWDDALHRAPPESWVEDAPGSAAKSPQP
jgi:tetratricopeptide (TPR) repeat protein